MSAQGMSLPVETTSELCPVIVMGMGGVPKPREGKTSPNGRQTYSSGTILFVRRKDGTIAADKSASVHVTEPEDTYEVGQQYMADGRVWVQPYENNARVALSITVERLVPLGGAL